MIYCFILCYTDPSINPSVMEMYADPTSKGGVLEPEATVEIKYRAKDVRKTMERLDPEMAGLAERLAVTGEAKNAQK
jgi:acetyl-CoA carboxylase/biotin carboxylase 1